VRTIHSAQGAKCDRVLGRMESFRANTVDAASGYVAISCAREGAAIYTSCSPLFAEALGICGANQVRALDNTMKVPEIATDTPCPSGS